MRDACVAEPQRLNLVSKREAAMGLLVALALGSAVLLLFGSKLVAVFGLVVACAVFSFPLGLIGLVALGVALLFLFTPHHTTDHRLG
jgi:hypothetical protein